jgi:hypothetical protein
MNSAQRHFLLASARWQPIIRQGVVCGHEPKGATHDKWGVTNKKGCPFAQAIVTAKALDRQAIETRKASDIKASQDAIAQWLQDPNHRVRKLAYDTTKVEKLVIASETRKGITLKSKTVKRFKTSPDYLNRAKARALPMGHGINGRV